MATSRDDFVIAIRSAFLKKGNQQRFSLIGLIFFSVGLIILSKINLPFTNYLKITLNEIVYRTSFIVSVPEKKILELSNKIQDHYNVYNDYVLVKEKIKTLESKKYETQFLEVENKRLKKAINEYIFKSHELIAKVLIDKNSPFLKSVIVNKGSKDKVKLGMAVLDGSYLVGKIVEVNYSTSRALLVSDLNSKIPVGIEPGNVQSILSGTGKQNGKIEYLETDILIKDKSIVYTSGSGGLFKSGIPVGVYHIDTEVYWSLKRIETLGYGFIFIAGMFNDAVLGFPIGISSLTYLIICGFAAYLRNITLRPSLTKDWLYFLFTISFANSINYFLLVLFFSIEINYYEILGNIIFTFLLYYIFAHIFDIYRKILLRIKI